MYQVAVAREIRAVRYWMFPIATFPDPFFTPLDLFERAVRRHGHGARKPRFEHVDAVGVVAVPRWKRPHSVNCAGQNSHGINPHWVMAERIAHGAAQGFDMCCQQITRLWREAEREKVGSGFELRISHIIG